MPGLFLITDTSAMRSLDAYAASEALRGKGLAEIARKVFQFIVSFALGDVPGGGQKKIPAGDKVKIRANLMRIVVQSRRLAAWRGASSSLRTRRVRRAGDELRGTLAAQLVRVLNYAGARTLRGPAFYRAVRRFVSGRVYAANLHRAGLLPALMGTKGRSGTRMPRFQNPPGDYRERLTEDVAQILAENWASAHGPRAKGIIGLAGYAFDMSLDEADRLLTGYLLDRMRRAAVPLGLSYSPS